MRFPRTAALVLAASLAVVPTPAQAGRETVQDTSDYDVPHRTIDMKSLTVSYTGKGVVAKLRFKDLRKQKRLRLFVQFYNQPDDDQFSPRYGNFLELRLTPRRKIKRVNWVFGPDDAFDGYHAERCQGIKIKPNFDKDVITYRLPNKCVRFLGNRGYITSYASTRRFTASHWDDGDPAATTGDWFDTTPGLVIEQ